MKMLKRIVLVLNVIDSVWWIGPSQSDQRTTIAPQLRDVRFPCAVATNEPVWPDPPKLIAPCAPLFLKFGRSFDLRLWIQNFDERPKHQSILFSYTLEQLFDRLAVSATFVEQGLKPLRVALGHARQWI